MFVADAQKFDLTVFRRDPMQLTLAATGRDLTGANPHFVVRSQPDATGPALLSLGPVTTIGAEGIRLIEVATDDNDVATSVLEIIATKASIIALPPPAQQGIPVVLAYDLQWITPAEGPGLNAIEKTVLFGTFTVMESVND